ncbi:MAG: hypothetical protein ABI402_11580 [Ferruginibacter sp.]
MKYFTCIFFLFSSLVSFGQEEPQGVFIAKDDASPFEWETKHMLVGRCNLINMNAVGSGEFIKVWTDNGIVDSGDYYLADYCVKPGKAGSVNVYSIQSIWNGEQYDTVSTKTTFTAIVPPQLSILVTKDDFKKNEHLRFTFIDKKTKKEAGKRYQVAAMYEPKVYDKKGILIGKSGLCFGKTIDFSTEKNDMIILDHHTAKSGDKIKISLWARDMKTDLLIYVDELIYTFK